MNPALLRTSWRAVGRSPLLTPVAAAVGLALATVSAHDGPEALRILRGIGILLAVACLAATDDPSGEVLAAAPVPRRTRTAGRVLAALAVVVPVWLLLLALLETQARHLPGAAVGLESLATVACGLAIGVGLRAWRDQHQPAYVAGAGLLALILVSSSLPRWYALTIDQTWGTTWLAAHLRWAAVLLLAASVLVAATRDPWATRRAI